MNKSRARSRALVAVVSAASLLALSACSVHTSSSGGSSGTTASGSLLFGADGGNPTFVRDFNPFSSNARTGAHYMYEPLEVVNSIEDKATPWLATGDKVVDPTTIQYTIRQGVKWSDGKPFSASDVVYTFDLIKKNPALDTLGQWQSISSVSASGDTVTFHLNGPDVPDATIIDQQIIVPQHIWQNVSDPVTWADPNPVATGPYVVGSFAPNEYTMKKNTSYWQADKVAAETLVLPASNTPLQLVKNGYDWAYSFIDNVDTTWVGANKQHNTYWFPPGGTIALLPNLTKAPFNNVDFRRGLSEALNRNTIATDAEEGYVKAAGQSGLLLPNQQSWLNPALPDQGLISQDTKQALQDFAKAGYSSKGGKLVGPSGAQLHLTITTANGYTDWLRGVQAVQSQLQALGIAVTIDQPQPAAYTQAENNGDFDLLMGAFGGSGSVYQDFNTLMSSGFAKPVGTAASGNFERFNDAQADQLLGQLKSATSVGDQQKIVDQLQQLMYDQVPVVSLFYGGLWGLFSDKSFTGWPSADDPYATPATWTENSLLILTHLKKAS
ncbi:MAG: ABC transporter substrate-binding protein [Microbacteriaceae bacterium]|nr:ABC transporter substrate-binding protein [Microbacteriaceae bacterium]MCL2796376.1 ABC transporter substrate-binding protein [Microbacteriaceae bacterium]